MLFADWSNTPLIWLRNAEFRIPIAEQRRIYFAHEVEKRLGKLPPKDHEQLRGTYERMLERGETRFQVKPSGVPAMEHLYDELPNFGGPLDEMKRSIALASDGGPLKVTPMLLLGSPGIGKTHFAKKVAELINTGMNFISMSSLTAGWVLSWASSQWKWARPGKVFESLVDGQYANPVTVVDEIDKARGEHAYDPLGSLYSLLEDDTAHTFVDEFAEVSIDASQVIWVATANDADLIPEPILNRMNVFEVKDPTHEQAMNIARRLYEKLRSTHDWGRFFDEEASEDVIAKMGKMKPRDMRRIWMRAFGEARLAKRGKILLSDIILDSSEKRGPGFVH